MSISKDKVVRVRMSEELLGKIDNAAKQEERSRSSWIRKTLKNNFKGDDSMKIVDVVELNKNGVEIEKEDSPVADRWFDDNGALPNGNFDENEIAGEWLVIDGKLYIDENTTYAYRTIDNTTLVDLDSFVEEYFYLERKEEVGKSAKLGWEDAECFICFNEWSNDVANNHHFLGCDDEPSKSDKEIIKDFIKYEQNLLNEQIIPEIK